MTSTTTDFIPTTKVGSIEVKPVNCSTIIDKQDLNNAKLVTMNAKNSLVA